MFMMGDLLSMSMQGIFNFQCLRNKTITKTMMMIMMLFCVYLKLIIVLTRNEYS